MKKILITIVAILIILIIVVGYLGFVPGISDVLGANKARDLGVSYTTEDLNKGRALTGVTLENLSDGGRSLAFSGSKDISGEYTSEIITAMINSAKYKYYPLSNTQIRISSDGTVEAAGNFNIDKALSWTNDLGTGSNNLEVQVRKYSKYISSNPSFYLKGTISVVDNQIELNLAQAQISRFTAPGSIIDQYQGQLADFVEDQIKAVPNMNIGSADFSSGVLKLNASYPAIERSQK